MSRHAFSMQACKPQNTFYHEGEQYIWLGGQAWVLFEEENEESFHVFPFPGKRKGFHPHPLLLLLLLLTCHLCHLTDKEHPNNAGSIASDVGAAGRHHEFAVGVARQRVESSLCRVEQLVMAATARTIECLSFHRIYSAGQKTVVEGCVIKTVTIATFDHVYLASRVSATKSVRICYVLIILTLDHMAGSRAVYECLFLPSLES